MTFLSAIILGIVEGLTEFLPVSSTAHLILTSQLLRLPSTDFQKSFEVIIQFGAILAVLVLYGKSVFVDRKTFGRILAAFIPTAIVGLALHSVIKNIFFESDSIILSALFIGGALILLFEHFHTERPDAKDEINNMTYKQAVAIGLFQSFAVIPGVSRAAATIIGGLLLGVSRKTIITFSFLLAVPTVLAASLLDLAKTGASFTGSEYLLLAIGFAVSFVTALAAIKWFLHFLKTHSFSPFGWYRVLLALVVWAALR